MTGFNKTILEEYSEALQMIYEGIKTSVVDIQGEKYGGSGIIISKNGYILTNAHVLEKAKEPTVTLFDGKKFSAVITGKDKLTDIGVLKIPCRNLKQAKIGDSSNCKIGQLVVAVGSSLGLQGTVTTGIISSTGRATKLREGTIIYGSIQTDAAINLGNSGGPLVNFQGKVIGINFQKILEADGISFAIPINTAMNIARKIIKYGEVKRADIGLRRFFDHPLPTDVKRKHKIRSDMGIFIEKIVFFSRWREMPAYTAGIKEKDIIISIDGKLMSTSESIDRFFTECPPGKVINVILLRDYGVIMRKKVKTEVME